MPVFNEVQLEVIHICVHLVGIPVLATLQGTCGGKDQTVFLFVHVRSMSLIVTVNTSIAECSLEITVASVLTSVIYLLHRKVLA